MFPWLGFLKILELNCGEPLIIGHKTCGYMQKCRYKLKMITEREERKLKKRLLKIAVNSALDKKKRRGVYILTFRLKWVSKKEKVDFISLLTLLEDSFLEKIDLLDFIILNERSAGSFDFVIGVRSISGVTIYIEDEILFHLTVLEKFNLKIVKSMKGINLDQIFDSTLEKKDLKKFKIISYGNHTADFNLVFDYSEEFVSNSIMNVFENEWSKVDGRPLVADFDMNYKKYNKFLKTKIELYIKEFINELKNEGNIFVYLEIEFQGHLTDSSIALIKEKLLTGCNKITSIFIFEGDKNRKHIFVSLKSIIGNNKDLPSILLVILANAVNIITIRSEIIDRDRFYELGLNLCFFNLENYLRIDLIFSLNPSDIVINIYDEIVLVLYPEFKIFMDFFEPENWVSAFIPIYNNNQRYTLLNLINYFFIKNDYSIIENNVVNNKNNDIYMSVDNFINNLGPIFKKLKLENSRELSRFDVQNSLMLSEGNKLKKWLLTKIKTLNKENIESNEG